MSGRMFIRMGLTGFILLVQGQRNCMARKADNNYLDSTNIKSHAQPG